MSKQSAKKFLNLAENDASFKKQLQAYPTPKGKREFAKENHLSYSKKELNEAIEEKYGMNLAPSEMKKIAAAGASGAEAVDEWVKKPPVGPPGTLNQKMPSRSSKEAIALACEAAQNE